MKVDQKLYDAARKLLDEHPDQAVSACYTEDGEILTGVSTDAHHLQVGLCAETGPVCEAQKLKKKIAASICLSNSSKLNRLVINPPCGVCQERLFWFGENVHVAIPEKEDPTQWQSVPLKQVQPHWWYASRLG